MRGILKAAAFAGVATAAVASAMTGAITGAGQAWATPQICEYRAPEQWRPLTEVEAAARALGHHKFFVQPDGGCWGVYARTSDGARIEILLDPMTLAVVRQGRS